MKRFWPLWAISLLAKMFLSSVIPMTNDETYYWVWSQHPQLSYFDHPPMVAWLLWLGHSFEFLGNAVRWPAVILGHLTIAVWYFIWRRYVSEDGHKFSWWLLLALFTPLFGFGSLLVTPDLPVLFFWSLSAYFFLGLTQNKKWSSYLLLGVSLGLGFCSKYHIVLFVLFAAVYLAKEKMWAVIFNRKTFATIATGLLFSSPVLVWNFQNQFESFLFQAHHGLGDSQYEFFWTWSYVLAQFLILSPPLVLAALRCRLPAKIRVLAYLSWGPLAFFLLTSLRGSVEVNWPIVAYPSFFLLSTLGSQVKKSIQITCIFWVIVFSVLVSQTITPWIPFAPEKINELSEFEPLLAAQTKYQPFYASSYQMASWLYYTTKTPIKKFPGISRVDFFDRLDSELPETYPIYIAIKEYTSMPEWLTQENYKITTVEKLNRGLIIVRIDKP